MAKCLLCKQTLPEGVTFCAGCGHQNEPDDLIKKQMGAQKQIDKRYAQMSFWQKLTSFFGLMR